MTAIFKRELRSYFNSMIGYVFVAVVVFYIGIYFMANNLFNGYPQFSYTLISATIIFIAAVPILTMKSMADDRKSKTDQLLLTAPVTLTKVVMGKYLAMVVVLGIPILLSCLCPLIIHINGESQLKADYASILAFFLMGCVFVSIGMFISSLTESQVIAAVGTFAALFILYLWSDLLYFMKVPDVVTDVLSAFAFRDIFFNFAEYGVFDLGGLFLYLSMSFVFVFLTIQTQKKRRWN